MKKIDRMGVLGFVFVLILTACGPVIGSPRDGKMVTIPSGEFMMGIRSPQAALAECQKYYGGCSMIHYQEQKQIHPVTLNTFEMDVYEVTNAQYAACVAAGVCTAPAGKSSSTRLRYYDDPTFANYPVIHVTWFEANTYCTVWRTKARLPTEAEWEKAARGGLAEKLYPWGDVFDGGKANFCDTNCSVDWAYKGANDGYADTAPVGSYTANGYGLYDMAGNVWEWTADWYGSDYYQNSPAKNPTGPQNGEDRILRGGSWYHYPDYLRVASRMSQFPAFHHETIGFRCVRSE